MIPPRSLRWRLAAWMFAATGSVAILLVVYYERHTHGLLSRELDDRLETLARHVAAASLLGTLANSKEILRGPLDGAISLSDVAVVAVYDPNGGPIDWRGRQGARAPAWQSTMVNCQPCVVGSERLRWVTPVTRLPTGRPPGENGFYEGPPPGASGGEEGVGWLMLDVTTAARAAAERQLTYRGLLIAGVALLLALVITLAIAQGVSSPLRALAQATREIGKGRWNAPLPRVTSTEIAQLADDFRSMTAALAELDRENRRYREHLEEMVASRTRELEAAYNRMKAMGEAKDQFVATVSHDFRSPLAIIQSAVQTVLADAEMPPDVRRRFLTRAERQCKRLGALVKDLLDLARIENRETVFERVPLSELIEDTIEGARAAFDERGVALVYQPPEDVVVAEVDRGHVGRALANLVDNALKFTPPAGRVTVDLRRAAGEACIAVTDTGPGIPDEEREHVFDRFFQGRQGQALGSGSGLGLAIVAGVVRRHGGTVMVTSAEGAGSTFQLCLPVSRA